MPLLCMAGLPKLMWVAVADCCLFLELKLSPTPGLPVGCCCCRSMVILTLSTLVLGMATMALSVWLSPMVTLALLTMYCPGGHHGAVGDGCRCYTDGHVDTVGSCNSNCCLSMVTMTLSILLLLLYRWSRRHCRLLLLLPVFASYRWLRKRCRLLLLFMLDGHNGTVCACCTIVGDRTDGHHGTVRFASDSKIHSCGTAGHTGLLVVLVADRSVGVSPLTSIGSSRC
jgi:hypothetical protein